MPPVPHPHESAQPLELTDAARAEARNAVVSRLIEVVTWPESRIPLYERQLAADLLLGLLRVSNVELRRKCAEGLARLADAPKALLRYLSKDEIQVAGALLEKGAGFDDSDLIAAVRAGTSAHWQIIAERRGLTEAVTDMLIQTADPIVIESVLKNKFSRLSAQGVEFAVGRSRAAAQLIGPLAQRPELRPGEGLTMFWWADFNARVQLLRRFAVDRSVLIKELGETFALAAKEGWRDPDARKALQVIERRQRNRNAAQQNRYGSLEAAIAAAGEQGLDPNMINEIAYMGGVKPATAAQIFSDPGGEAIAVFAKSVGLKRAPTLNLWRALQRPAGDADHTDNPLGRMMFVFDTLATAKAQTVLRYWNWSFTADAQRIEEAPLELDADAAISRRNAQLLFRRGG